ncbi:hypothetical protein EV182_003844 [Spiromyces aspiralis]|uniref:Uncharacterized protein n=1 Tax=Spiromyces aspiralis TaxID=68401 RepID=A0ACC1HQN0_9FUNG|nr:hypothetical protein EV182_003844 [Spiromyces aspiralis]
MLPTRHRMFKSIFQSGVLCILHCRGNKQLQLWEVHDARDDESDDCTQYGRLMRHFTPSVVLVEDNILGISVIGLYSPKIRDCYISCPSGNETLGIKLPKLMMAVRNLNHHFSMEVEVKDARGLVFRFRASTYQERTIVTPDLCVMPLRLEAGWNQAVIDFAQLCREVYSATFTEVNRVTLHPNLHVHHIIFSDRIIPEDELPQEFKLQISR